MIYFFEWLHDLFLEVALFFCVGCVIILCGQVA